MATPAGPAPRSTQVRLPNIFTRQGTTSLKNSLLILTLGYSTALVTTRVVDWVLVTSATYLPSWLLLSTSAGGARGWPSLVSLAGIGSGSGGGISLRSALKPCVAACGRLFGRLGGGLAVGLCWLIPGIEVDEFAIMVEDLQAVADEEEEGEEQAAQQVEQDEEQAGDGVEYQVGFDDIEVQ